MTASTGQSSINVGQQNSITDELAANFTRCLQEEAERIQGDFEESTPMKAQARALIWLDTLAKLHESGLEEAIKSNDASQAAAWTRDLGILEVVLALLKNIQPMDININERSATQDVEVDT